MSCSAVLRAEGEPYPRTCPDHGLFTPCPPVGPPKKVIHQGGYFTVKDLIAELQEFLPDARVTISAPRQIFDVNIVSVEEDDVNPSIVVICGE